MAKVTFIFEDIIPTQENGFSQLDVKFWTDTDKVNGEIDTDATIAKYVGSKVVLFLEHLAKEMAKDNEEKPDSGRIRTINNSGAASSEDKTGQK